MSPNRKCEFIKKEILGKGNQFRCWNRMPLLLAWLAFVSVAAYNAEAQLVLKVRHDHAWGSCSGTLALDDRGARYETTHKKDARNWTYDDVQQFQVEEGRRLRVITYEDRKWRLGADKVFVFDWSENDVTPEEIYHFLEAHTRRPIAAWLRLSGIGEARYEFLAKHLGTLKGHQGRLLFTERYVIFQADKGANEKDGDRAWRYEDLESISSSGLYELTLTTHEQQKFHYASRRVYQFQLKEALPPDHYDEVWRFVNGKKGIVNRE